MANIHVVLQYNGHEAHTDVPLSIDLPETLRRVKLKRGPSPHNEAVYQVASEVCKSMEDSHLVQGLLQDLLKAVDS